MYSVANNHFDLAQLDGLTLVSHSLWISLAFSWLLVRLTTFKYVHWLSIFLLCESHVYMAIQFSLSSLMHLELNFVNDVNSVSNVIV